MDREPRKNKEIEKSINRFQKVLSTAYVILEKKYTMSELENMPYKNLLYAMDLEAAKNEEEEKARLAEEQEMEKQGSKNNDINNRIMMGSGFDESQSGSFKKFSDLWGSKSE